MIKIVITDDMPIVLEGLRLLLGRIPDFSIVGEYQNGKELVDHAAASDADIFLTDIDMPVMNGIDATKQIISKDPDKKIVALSMHSDRDNYYKMIKAGARGFVLKHSSVHELEEAVRTVYEGKNFFSNELLHNVIVTFSNTDETQKNEDKIMSGLTPKELSFFRLVCQGLTNKELSEKLFVSIKTIESYKTRLMSKTETRNTSGLILWAIKNKVIEI
jgi:DNA-binding NarL/FixJ family response regulator